MKSKRDRRIVGLLVMLALLIAIAFLAFRRGPSLLDRATRVASVADWEVQSGDYYWLSDHEVLAFKGSDKLGWTILRHDMRTGTDETLQVLTKLFRSSNGLRNWALSPDRSTLMWRCADDRIIGANLDGQRLFVSRNGIKNTTSAGLYLGNDLRWVEPFLTTNQGNATLSGALIHDEKHGGAVKKVVFNPSLNQSLSVIMTAQGHLVMDTGHGGDFSTSIIKTTDLNVTASNASFKTYTARLPGSFANGVAYSPGGDRVAWFLDKPRVSLGFARMWNRLFHPHNPIPPSDLSLSVSGLQGEGLREIGSVEYQASTSADSWQLYPHFIKWLPDGKTISFIYDGSLWTVPAD